MVSRLTRSTYSRICAARRSWDDILVYSGFRIWPGTDFGTAYCLIHGASAMPGRKKCEKAGLSLEKLSGSAQWVVEGAVLALAELSPSLHIFRDHSAVLGQG